MQHVLDLCFLSRPWGGSTRGRSVFPLLKEVLFLVLEVAVAWVELPPGVGGAEGVVGADLVRQEPRLRLLQHLLRLGELLPQDVQLLLVLRMHGEGGKSGH